MDNDNLSLKEKLSYGMGSFGNNIIYGLMTTYLMIYYTDTFGLPLVAINLLFLIARTWDAFSDPIIGHIVDNTHTRWGRFRPYLLFGPFAMGVIIILLFSSPNFSTDGKIIWAYFTYIAWGMAFASMDIPFWSMSAALTQDPVERSSLIMIPRTIAVVGIILATVITIPLLNLFGGSSTSKKGWLLMAIVFALASIIFTLITFFNVKERTKVSENSKHKLKDIFILFKVNTPLRNLIISMLIGDFILAVKSAFTVYYLKYNFKAENMIDVFMGIYALATIFGSVLSPKLAKKIGKKKVALVGSTGTAIASIAMFFSGYHSMALLAVWTIIGGYADGTTDIARMSMLADTVEYGEWKTGKRQEGIIFSVNIFKTKIASAIAGSACITVLQIFHYVPNKIQSSSTLNGIHSAYTIIPGVIALLALVPLSKYDLIEEKYSEILLELKERKMLNECNE